MGLGGAPLGKRPQAKECRGWRIGAKSVCNCSQEDLRGGESSAARTNPLIGAGLEGFHCRDVILFAGAPSYDTSRGGEGASVVRLDLTSSKTKSSRYG